MAPPTAHRQRAALVALVALCAATLLGARAQGERVRAVATGLELQAAANEGVEHIVITQHLNMTDVPTLSKDASAVRGNNVTIAPGPRTKSVRGNCRAPPARASEPPPTPGQCVIVVAEDFLEVGSLQGSLWLDNLYVWLPPEAGKSPNYDAGTLIGAHGGHLYMTRVALVGNNQNCRGIDVGEGRVYARDSVFSQFAKDTETAVRLKEGTAATFYGCRFANNKAFTGSSDKLAIGPALGVQDADGAVTATRNPAYAWLHDCAFEENTAVGAPGADAAKKSDAARVLSNTPLPLVYNEAAGAVQPPTGVRVRPDGEEGAPDPLFERAQFLTEGTRWFSEVTQEPVTGAMAMVPSELPPPEAIVLVAPDAGGGGASHRTRDIALITLACVAAAALVAMLCVFCLLRGRRRKGGADVIGAQRSHLESALSPQKGAISSSAPSGRGLSGTSGYGSHSGGRDGSRTRGGGGFSRRTPNFVTPEHTPSAHGSPGGGDSWVSHPRSYRTAKDGGGARALSPPGGFGPDAGGGLRSTRGAGSAVAWGPPLYSASDVAATESRRGRGPQDNVFYGATVSSSGAAMRPDTEVGGAAAAAYSAGGYSAGGYGGGGYSDGGRGGGMPRSAAAATPSPCPSAPPTPSPP